MSRDGAMRPGASACLHEFLDSGERGGFSLSRNHLDTDSLLRTETAFLRSFVRLQVAEQALSSQVQRRSGRGLIPARQLELERQRLGRELHTGLGQLLSAIRLQLDLIGRQLSDPRPGIRQALDRIGTLSAEALDLVRSISRRLHPPAWQGLTLENSLRQLWEVSGIADSFDSSLTIDTLPEQPGQDTKVLLYRAAQEAISNVIRHSHASRVSASLSLTGADLLLRFEDNGVGFDADRLLAAPANLNAGLGLRTIREQAEALGGRLRIESGPEGVKLEVMVGLSAEQG